MCGVCGWCVCGWVGEWVVCKGKKREEIHCTIVRCESTVQYLTGAATVTTP